MEILDLRDDPVQRVALSGEERRRIQQITGAFLPGVGGLPEPPLGAVSRPAEVELGQAELIRVVTESDEVQGDFVLESPFRPYRLRAWVGSLPGEERVRASFIETEGRLSGLLPGVSERLLVSPLEQGRVLTLVIPRVQAELPPFEPDDTVASADPPDRTASGHAQPADAISPHDELKVLFVVTSAAVEQLPDHIPHLQIAFNLFVASLEDVLQTGGSNITLAAVCRMAETLSETGDIKDDLDLFAAEALVEYQGSDHSLEQARHDFEADLVVFVAGADAYDPDEFGGALLPPADANAFCIVTTDSVGDVWLAHELGHLLGADHDYAICGQGALCTLMSGTPQLWKFSAANAQRILQTAPMVFGYRP